jgi:hypothetical protein
MFAAGHVQPSVGVIVLTFLGDLGGSEPDRSVQHPEAPDCGYCSTHTSPPALGLSLTLRLAPGSLLRAFPAPE